MIFGNYRPILPARSRHKVFISYYHRDDQDYRDQFERRYGHLFISKSVQPGNIDSDLSGEYIKRLIRENYITDCSVVVVLVGPNTKRRKHVDWEISAGLSKKAGGQTGLIAFLLPSFPVKYNPLTRGIEYWYSDLPERLADNARSGYAQVHLWPGVLTPDRCVSSALETAFFRRITHASLIRNSWDQMQRNRPDQNRWNLRATLFGGGPPSRPSEGVWQKRLPCGANHDPGAARPETLTYRTNSRV